MKIGVVWSRIRILCDLLNYNELFAFMLNSQQVSRLKFSILQLCYIYMYMHRSV